jgi:Fe2+ transport system protein B
MGIPSPQRGSSPTPPIAVAGNPNAGKTSLFNSLTGQTKGSELSRGWWRARLVNGRSLRVATARLLICVYSLDATSLDEEVAETFCLVSRKQQRTDIVNVDATIW